jgi:hypothetical protein
MNQIAANQLIIEIVIRLVTGSDSDRATAKQMASRLDDAALRRLRVAGQEAEILAENIFFEKRREKRRGKFTA